MYETQQERMRMEEDRAEDAEEEEAESERLYRERLEQAIKKAQELERVITADRKGYRRYLQEYLPLNEVHVSYASEPQSKEFEAGFERFLADIKHRRDTKVRGLGIYMHCDISRCCGILHYAGRVEADERPKLLLHRMFQDVTSKGLLEPSKDVTFTLHQRDLIPLHRPLHKTLPVVVLQATVQSPTCSLREARITLTLLDSEFLAMEQPRAGAEVIEPRDVDGSIKFCESSYADSAPGRAVYVGYETAGSMSISILSKTSVEMKLTPDQGRRTTQLQRTSGDACAYTE